MVCAEALIATNIIKTDVRNTLIFKLLLCCIINILIGFKNKRQSKINFAMPLFNPKLLYIFFNAFVISSLKATPKNAVFVAACCNIGLANSFCPAFA